MLLKYAGNHAKTGMQGNEKHYVEDEVVLADF